MGSNSQWTWHHTTVFLLTFFGYALFHGCRKSWSNVKDLLEKEITPANLTDPVQPYDLWEKRRLFGTMKDANVFSGLLDTLFLSAYAIGLFLSGMLGDRINLRYLLSCGMMLSALAMFSFGYVTEVTGFRNKYFYGSLYFLCGLFQSTGWPTTVAIMANWFGKNRSGLVFGIWSANSSFGNIIGALLVSSVLDYGYEYGMLITSYFLFCGGILVLFCLFPSPTNIGLPQPDTPCEESEGRRLLDSVPNVTVAGAKKSNAISLVGALLLPGVIPYSLAYACLKLVNYSFFFWLPVYLDQGLHWSDSVSDRLSNFFDGGGIAGGIIAGALSDYIHKRSPVMVSFLLLSIGSLFWYSNVGGNHTTNVAVMTLLGFFIGGPANIISSAITADLGKQIGAQGNKDALATVTGIVDGTGSVGAAIGQILVPLIQKMSSWNMVFYFLIIMQFLSIVCISPMLYSEVKGCKKTMTTRRMKEDAAINDISD